MKYRKQVVRNLHLGGTRTKLPCKYFEIVQYIE